MTPTFCTATFHLPKVLYPFAFHRSKRNGCVPLKRYIRDDQVDLECSPSNQLLIFTPTQLNSTQQCLTHQPTTTFHLPTQDLQISTNLHIHLVLTLPDMDLQLLFPGEENPTLTTDRRHQQSTLLSILSNSKSSMTLRATRSRWTEKEVWGRWQPVE